MNILFIEDSDNLGGVQESTLLLAEGFIKQNYKVNVLIPNEGEMSKRLKKGLIPYWCYEPVRYLSTSISINNDSSRIINPIAFIWNFFAIIINSYKIKKNIKTKIEIVITKGLINHLCSGIAFNKYNRIKVIWHLQDLITKRYFNLGRIFFNSFAREVPDSIICDSLIIKDSLDKKSQKKTSVILNGIKTRSLISSKDYRKESRKELNIPKNAYVLGHLARITPWKGQLYLVKAFIEYSRSNSNAYLLLVGSPLFTNGNYINSIRTIINESNLKDKIILAGYNKDLKKMFSVMDLFLYPSLEKDTTPLALISAMAAGLPVVMSKINSLIDIINHCPTIETFDPSSIKQLIAYMKKYENESLRYFHGKTNRKTAKKYFDIELHTNSLTLILKQLLNTA